KPPGIENAILYNGRILPATEVRMRSAISTDVLIVGAGVAGLWLNARLRRQGFSTILVESSALGGGQSLKSQGIIHGGAKYRSENRLALKTRSSIMAAFFRPQRCACVLLFPLTF